MHLCLIGYKHNTKQFFKHMSFQVNCMSETAECCHICLDPITTSTLNAQCHVCKATCHITCLRQMMFTRFSKNVGDDPTDIEEPLLCGMCRQPLYAPIGKIMRGETSLIEVLESGARFLFLEHLHAYIVHYKQLQTLLLETARIKSLMRPTAFNYEERCRALADKEQLFVEISRIYGIPDDTADFARRIAAIDVFLNDGNKLCETMRGAFSKMFPLLIV